MIKAKLHLFMKAALIAWAVVAVYAHVNVGLSDNGDFFRSVRAFSMDGPIGLLQANSPGCSDYWDHEENFKYWFPYWKLEWRKDHFETSTLFLWLPGIIVNYFCYSKNVLFLPFVALLPKCFLILTLISLFYWIEANFERGRTLVLGLVGVPFVLFISDTRYQSYFNSFYQETGEFIYLLLFLFSLVYLRCRPRSKWRLIGSLGSLSLLGTSKLSALYVIPLGIPAILFLFDGGISRKIMIAGGFVAGLAVLGFLFSYFQREQTEIMRCHSFQRVFAGELIFSNDVRGQLAGLGLQEAQGCVGHDISDDIGNDCVKTYGGKTTFRTFLQVLEKEPAILPKMIMLPSKNMQRLQTNFFKYTIDNPLNAEGLACEKYEESGQPLLLWSGMKSRFFPTGPLLFMTLFIYLIFFVFQFGKAKPVGDLSIVGGISAMFCLVDMLVAIIGDGACDLAKHLFLANALFDVATISFISVVFIGWGLRAKGILERSKIRP